MPAKFLSVILISGYYSRKEVIDKQFLLVIATTCEYNQNYNQFDNVENMVAVNIIRIYNILHILMFFSNIKTQGRINILHTPCIFLMGLMESIFNT